MSEVCNYLKGVGYRLLWEGCAAGTGENSLDGAQVSA